MNPRRWSAVLVVLVLAAAGIFAWGEPARPRAAATGAPRPQDGIPWQCLDEKNHGNCLNCCMEAAGPTVPAKACNRFCKGILPPPPPEPIP